MEFTKIVAIRILLLSLFCLNYKFVLKYISTTKIDYFYFYSISKSIFCQKVFKNEQIFIESKFEQSDKNSEVLLFW